MNQSINERDLNASQFERLKTLYVETIVNSMSHEDLLIYVTNDMEDFRQYVRNDMWDYLGESTFSGVLNEIKYTLDDEMLEEFVTEIKGQSEGKNV